MAWHDALVKKITVDEYYIHWRGMQFRVRYIVHNGYTVIEALKDYNKSTSDFEEWFHLRSDLNTRYDQPHYWRPILWSQDKQIVDWATKAIAIAYDQYTQENVRRAKK